MAEPSPSSTGRSSRSKFEEANQLKTVDRLVESSKKLHIFTVGKTGAGKSSLVKDLVGPSAQRKPVPKSGLRPVTLEAEAYDIFVGDVSVLVYDTRGLCDVSGEQHASETLDKIGEICNNDVHGLLLVCIDMHQRMDESTLKTLALIHRKFGKEIWRYAVIALTKADTYPTNEWLGEKSWWVRKRPILEEKFEAELHDAEVYLRSLFISTDADAGSENSIGLTREDFDELAIPFVPTSKLTNNEAMKRMEIVGHESWFDTLLVECVKRERGIALVKIHSQRLSRLPASVVEKRDPTGLFRKFVREVLKSVIGDILPSWRLYWSRYCQKEMVLPRFEKDTQK